MFVEENDRARPGSDPLLKSASQKGVGEDNLLSPGLPFTVEKTRPKRELSDLERMTPGLRVKGTRRVWALMC